jgi:hypothetical protein
MNMAKGKKVVTPVLTFKLENLDTVSVYLLNVGDFMPGFGGSRHSLQARETASLITRHVGPMGLRDTERDLDDPSTWQWLARLMNSPTCTAEPGVPEDDQSRAQT